MASSMLAGYNSASLFTRSVVFMRCGRHVPIVASSGPLCHRKHSCQVQPQRGFFRSIKPPFKPPTSNPHRMQYSEKRVLGYSMEQMFDVVSRVEDYDKFVPWCRKSSVSQHKRGIYRCNLTIGFPPILERYESKVTTIKPHLVKSECTDGVLFSQLLTVWRLGPGLNDRSDTCTVYFSVAFEFKSSFYSHIAQMFFDDIVHTMVNAFLERARTLYGPQSIEDQERKILVYSSS